MYKPRPTWSRVGGLLVSVVLATSPLVPSVAYAASAVVKAETVHVETDAAGGVSSITVEELLANDDKSTQLLDFSTLEGIEASEEGQSFVKESDGTLTWNTDGKQVSYEGVATQTLPVEVEVSYTLDGRSVSPAELAGASGHLVMRIDYHNNTDAVRGMRTPFVCLSAVTLDSDIFANVEVENGKVIDDKGGFAVIGYALPGLRESLDLDDLELDLPEYVQISADVTDLSLDPIYTIITPELFGELDTSELGLDFGDLDEGTGALEDAMGQLVKGSNSLTGVLKQLASGSEQLGGGMAAFLEKISVLPTGMSALSAGLDELSAGLTATSGAASQLSEGASGVAGLAQDAQSGVAEAQGDVSTAQDKVAQLKRALAQLGDTKQALVDGEKAATTGHDAATDAGELLASVDAAVDEQKAVAASDISAAIEALDDLPAEGLTDEQQQALDTAKQQLAAAASDVDQISAAAPAGLANDITALSEAARTMQDSADKLDGASKALDGASAAEKALDAAQNSLLMSSQELNGVAGGAANVRDGAAGLAQALDGAATGSQQIAASLGEMSSFAPQMVEGISALSTGISQLASGLAATAQGSGQLTSALKTFDDEGISAIVDALSDMAGEVDDLTGRLDSLRDASNAYDSFAGKLDSQSGSVRFIYKTERIG